MFDNIGNKIKGLAKAICWIGIITFCIWGIVYWDNAADLHAGFLGFLAGLGIIVGGSLASWIGSFATYALGELVENSSDILAVQKRLNIKLDEIIDKLESIYKDEPLENQEDQAENSNALGKCAICGQEDVPLDRCEVIEFENGAETRRNCLVCKNCQETYK